MTEEEPRDWYAEADAYEKRLTLAHRIGLMVALTVLAVPVVRVIDKDDSAGDSVASGVETASVAPELAGPAETTPVTTTAPAAVVTVGPITTGPGADPAPSNSSAAVDVDIAALPEITAPADSGNASSRSGGDPSFEDLPEITAPPSATAAPTAPPSSDDDDGASTAAAPATTADSDDDEPAATTATTKPPSTTTTDDEPATTTTTAPPPPSYSAEQVKQFVRDAWPDGADEEMALAVAQHESGYRADAVSPTKCCLGIFQVHYEANQKFINSLGFDRDDLFDAAKNVQIAFAMWQRSGWGPWSQTTVLSPNPLPQS